MSALQHDAGQPASKIAKTLGLRRCPCGCALFHLVLVCHDGIEVVAPLDAEECQDFGRRLTLVTMDVGAVQ